MAYRYRDARTGRFTIESTWERHRDKVHRERYDWYKERHVEPEREVTPPSGELIDDLDELEEYEDLGPDDYIEEEFHATGDTGKGKRA